MACNGVNYKNSKKNKNKYAYNSTVNGHYVFLEQIEYQIKDCNNYKDNQYG